jgi:purine-binding chemotaxis protein CheW
MMTNSLFLFATIAQTPVAVCADEVEAVVRLEDIVPVNCTQQFVAGLAALRSRVLTVIDMESRVLGRPGVIGPRPLAVVAEIGGHTYGLLVANVHDICVAPEPPFPVHGRIDSHWVGFTRQMINFDGRSHLLLSLADFACLPANHVLAA